jgi:hypothetical protein
MERQTDGMSEKPLDTQTQNETNLQTYGLKVRRMVRIQTKSKTDVRQR